MIYSRNLVGKTFDFDWFSIKESTLVGEVNFSFAGTSRRVTGLDKMVQRWLYLFLTPIGSDIYDPGLGTDLHRILEATLADEAYITNVINASVNDASEQLSASQTLEDNLSADEKFVSATVKSVNFIRNELRVDARIALVNAQGSARILTLPTPMANAPI